MVDDETAERSKTLQQPNDRQPLRGVIVPILTPLTPDEAVDVASLRRLVNYLVDNGVHGIWAAGTTGEFAALDEDGRRLVIETVAEETAGRVPVIGNVSAPATRAAACAAAALRDCPLAGVAATPPYYYNHSQAELSDHFHAIRERCHHPLWVYNIPSTVKLTVEPATIAALAADGTVAGVKDSSGAGEAFAQLAMLCRHRQLDLYRFVGSVWRITMAGIDAHGVIPGIANLVPRSVAATWEAAARGDAEAALRRHAEVLTATRATQLGRGGVQASSFSGLKAALKLLGVIEHDTVSAPLRPLSDEEKSELPVLLAQLGLR